MRNKSFLMSLAVILAVFLATSLSARAGIIDLVTNGNFESQTLTGWTQIDPANTQEWGITHGTVGGEHIHAVDSSYFATPWTNGPNPAHTCLSQKIDFSAYAGSITDNKLHIAADMIYSNDGIACSVKYYDSLNNPVSSQQLAEKRSTISGNVGYNYALNMDLDIPQQATAIEIIFKGELFEGSYIDAGFDNVSLTADVVPEPASVLLLTIATGYMLKKRKQYF